LLFPLKKWAKGAACAEKGNGQVVERISKVHSTNMKNSPLITLLLVMVCGLSAVILLLVVAMEFRHRTARQLQPIVANNQLVQSRVNALAAETLEYSKHNPAIDPILQAVGIKPGGPAAVSNKPAGNK
jgi:hypothetical protein